jgi:ATP-dependent Clp protease ATP-binding subunit ClpA
MSEISRELHLMLQAALREAVMRRHAYVTVEHLLYALIHDGRGAEVLQHSGADLTRLKAALERYFDDDLEHVPGEEPFETHQTIAFHRVLQGALSHCERAEKEEVDAGDVLAAIFQEPESHSVTLLRAQEVTRLDVLQYISHGTSKLSGRGGAPSGPGGEPAFEDPGFGEPGELPADPLAAFSTNLAERAAAGKLDPLIGRGDEIDRIVHILARRRKNNPIFVGETGVGKTALAEGLALRIHEGRVPEDLRDAEIFSRLRGPLQGVRRGGPAARQSRALHR